LTELVGPARAMELIMTGERIDAEMALRFGIVNEVFEDDHLVSVVKTRAEALAAAPTEAIAAIKQGVRRALSGSLTDTLAWESTTQRALFLSGDAREGMRAFLEKRSARFGRSDQH
jgi:enoyl-CoA hydratase/carnithine racemase